MADSPNAGKTHPAAEPGADARPDHGDVTPPHGDIEARNVAPREQDRPGDDPDTPSR